MAARSPVASAAFSYSSSWKGDFLQVLALRDKREKSYDEFIFACPASTDPPWGTWETNLYLDSRLALRTTALASTNSPTEAAPGKEVGDTAGGVDITQLKADLTAAQQSKLQLQSRIKSLSDDVASLQQKQELFDRTSTERNRLDRRTKDLEEEVKAKNKHIQELQDEILTLTMELNMLNKKEQAIRKENAELVERFMAEMAKKAENMNRASNWE